MLSSIETRFRFMDQNTFGKFEVIGKIEIALLRRRKTGAIPRT